MMTARGWNFRCDSLIEIDRNSYDLSSSSFELSDGTKRGRFSPYDYNKPELHGLTKEQVANFGLEQPRLISYSDGLLLVAGQHRGLMLKSTLSRTSHNFKIVIHVDDEKQYSEQIREVFKGSGVDIHSFRYTREDGNRKNLDDSSKQLMTNQWMKLDQTVKAVFLR